MQSRTGAIAAGVVALAVAALRVPAAAIDVNGDLSLLGQVRRGDQNRDEEAPVDFYASPTLSGLPYGSSISTFSRLEEDFGPNTQSTDFYAGYLEVPAAVPGMDFTVGRQFLTLGVGAPLIADAGKIRLDVGGQAALTVFGGAPRYFEPTYSTDVQSRDETIFGGEVRSTNLRSTVVRAGYFQQERENHVVRQVLTGAFTRSFVQTPGLPSVYGNFGFDATRPNVDLAVLGGDAFLGDPHLRLNLEGSYYKPQDQGKYLSADLNRQEDALFELFSVSQLLQFRGGLSYAVRRTLTLVGDYSYQRYNPLAHDIDNGHIGSVGVVWLPGGDGLEVLRVEYYVVDSGGGNVNGGRVFYESRVYERLVFRSHLDLSYYEKATNESGTAFGSLLALGYLVQPGLVYEVNLEANHNKRFDEDIRFGFRVTYTLGQRSARNGEAS